MGILKCVFVIIGSIIGAGFASGKEIYTFFFIYGEKGIIGIIISIFLIGYIIFKALKIIHKYEINNYSEFIKILINNKKFNDLNIEIIINCIMNIFLLMTFFIMCAGLSAYFKQEFKANELISSIIIAIISYFILEKNSKGVIFINTILIPVILIILTVFGIRSINTIYEFTNNKENILWIVKAILYASYNTITLISILMPMKKYINSKLDILKITILSSGIIMLMAFIVFVLLLNIKYDISTIELPTVYAIRDFGEIYKYLYGVIIIGAIITTEIASGYGFLNNLSRDKNKYNLYNKAICIASIPVALLGFSNLINNIYPIFGVIGLFQIFLIIKCK